MGMGRKREVGGGGREKGEGRVGVILVMIYQ